MALLMASNGSSPTHAEPALEVRDLCFRYEGGGDVLKGADLLLTPGRVSGLLGANGSGKSTLLGAITDAIQGERRGSVDIARGAVGPIGYATQDVALYLHLTVAENVTHAARLATGLWDVRDLVELAIDDYGLGPIRNQRARFLSGGQQRIAHIACAFAHAPTVRLLDEPTTALDFETRQLLIELVASWSDQGIATLVTAHYPEDVEELCQSITLLVEGQTYDLGPLRDYLARQSRLGSIEQIAGDDRVIVTELDGPLLTLDDIASAASEAGIGGERDIHAIQIRPPSLRDLLRRDPSLRGAIEDEERQL